MIILFLFTFYNMAARNFKVMYVVHVFLLDITVPRPVIFKLEGT